MQTKFFLFLFWVTLAIFSSNCGSKKADPMLHIKLKIDSSQERLDNTGNAAPNGKTGNATQTPTMNNIGIHYVSFLKDQFTPIGTVVLNTPETTSGGAKAIDFAASKRAADGEIWVSIPLKDVAVGTYQYVRTSVSYQNFGIKFNLINVPNIGSLMDEEGIAASFLGSNTYISTHKVNKLDDVVNGNKLQGYWSFETNLHPAFATYNKVYTGQSPEGTTTVVNPIAGTSPVPAGSCLVTGKFGAPLVISGTETGDVTVTLSFSTNQSFEWKEVIKNGKWDIDVNRTMTEQIMDMGLRGMKASAVTAQ